ncbi:MAG TPA: hypothetical protein VIN71_13220, partial [Pseudomonadales bacterium]
QASNGASPTCSRWRQARVHFRDCLAAAVVNLVGAKTGAFNEDTVQPLAAIKGDAAKTRFAVMRQPLAGRQ